MRREEPDPAHGKQDAMYAPDQESGLNTIIAAAEADEHVLALYLYGSWGMQAADAWSDLDLLAILADPTRRWLPDLGVVFAEERSRDDRGELRRLVYAHGLCVDLLTVSPEAVYSIQALIENPLDFQKTGDRRINPFYILPFYLL